MLKRDAHDSGKHVTERSIYHPPLRVYSWSAAPVFRAALRWARANAMVLLTTLSPGACAPWRTGCQMTTMRQIRQLSQRIARQFNPERIVLFGSHARGRPTADSDVDLLVVLSHQGRAVEKSVEIRMQVRPPFPLDLLVRTPGKIRQRMDMGDTFIRDIMEKGKVLYEANDG